MNCCAEQYLVPRRSVAKLQRQLSRQHKVSVTEIVRRAIEAYDPSSGDRAVQEAAALELLEAKCTASCANQCGASIPEMAALQSRQACAPLMMAACGNRHGSRPKGWLRRDPLARSMRSRSFLPGSLPRSAAAGTAGAAGSTAGNGARVRALRR